MMTVTSQLAYTHTHTHTHTHTNTHTHTHTHTVVEVELEEPVIFVNESDAKLITCVTKNRETIQPLTLSITDAPGTAERGRGMNMISLCMFNQFHC